MSNSGRLIVFIVVAVLSASIGSGAMAGVRELVTPKAVIYPGERIRANLVAKVRFRVRRNFRNVYVDDISQIIDQVAHRTLVPGRPINFNAIRRPYVIDRGQPTTLVFRHGALTILGSGVALEPGAAGKLIRVKNSDSGVIVSGIVRADGTVRVGAVR